MRCFELKKNLASKTDQEKRLSIFDEIIMPFNLGGYKTIFRETNYDGPVQNSLSSIFKPHEKSKFLLMAQNKNSNTLISRLIDFKILDQHFSTDL